MNHACSALEEENVMQNARIRVTDLFEQSGPVVINAYRQRSKCKLSSTKKTKILLILLGREGPRPDFLRVFCFFFLPQEVEERGEGTRNGRTARRVLRVVVWLDSKKSDVEDGQKRKTDKSSCCCRK